MIPTYVVIPVERGRREEMTANLVRQLGDYPIRVDDSEETITFKWNVGLEWASWHAAGAAHNVAVLNNDVEVPRGFLDALAAGLRSHPDNWIAYPEAYSGQIPLGLIAESFNPFLAGQTMSGWAFMLRGEAGLRFDEHFEWWYGDSDIEKQVRRAGKRVVAIGGCHARHLEADKSTFSRPELLAAAWRDEARFALKWGIDPATLWLAQHPEVALSHSSI